MKYTLTDGAGATIVNIESYLDCRVFFSRRFGSDGFAECGLKLAVAQSNNFFDYTQGTSRGLHRQVPPWAGAKLACCTRGAIAAAAVDVRPGSQTYRRHSSARFLGAEPEL